MAALYLVTSFEPLILLLVTQHLLVLQQLLPLLRFDGYYVLSDLTGVPDVLGRVKPVLRSLLPGRGDEPRVKELKPWARRTVRVYVLALVPLLGGLLVMLVLVAPRMVATAWDALGPADSTAWTPRPATARSLAATAAVVQSISLALPLLGLALSLGRVGGAGGAGARALGARQRLARRRRAGRDARGRGRPRALWWPNGEYEPLRPGERGTVHDAVRAAKSIPTGRPSFTPAARRALPRGPDRARARGDRAATQAPQAAPEEDRGGPARRRRPRRRRRPPPGAHDDDRGAGRAGPDRDRAGTGAEPETVPPG